MKAYAADRHGPISELTLRDVPMPKPGPRQLLVKVAAAAVNPADLKVLEHRDGGSFLHASRFPLILGFDFSGTIAGVGAELAGQRDVGDEIYGFLPYSSRTRGGTYAEYVAVDVDKVGRKPGSLTHEQAAAAATSVLSAIQALRDKGRLAGGQAVLINGASGGVGSYAVQLAKILGATVTATASAAKLEYVKRLGADHVLDYKTTRLADLDQRFAVIFDAASTSNFGTCSRLLERGGTYVATLPSPRLVLGMARALVSSKRCTFLVVKPLARDFDQAAAWFDEGKLTPVLDTAYPLAELPEALERLRAGDVRGKLAITIG